MWFRLIAHPWFRLKPQWGIIQNPRFSWPWGVDSVNAPWGFNRGNTVIRWWGGIQQNKITT
jgi:hypothetical protein